MNTQIEEIIAQAGGIVRSADHAKQLEENKTGPRDFVTLYDRKVQEFLFDALTDCIPNLALIGEEGDAGCREDIPKKGSFVIVDPIDGTANFVKDIKRSCVSIAYGEDGRIVEGYVYDPYIDELFCAQEGTGAFVKPGRSKCAGTGSPAKPGAGKGASARSPFGEGRRLVRDNDTSIAESMVCFGTSPYRAELAAKTFAAAEYIFGRSLDVRRTGTAALDLCYSAANRFDLYFEGDVSPWDHAAGALVVREAGGRTVTFDGGAPSLTEKCSMVSGSARAVEEFLKLVRDGVLF